MHKLPKSDSSFSFELLHQVCSKNEMYARSRHETASTASLSSVDWECDAESQSWSSSASWSDDIESEATARLWQQLQDIDSVLYGEASPNTLPPALRQEVAQWQATFPHLRVCGRRPPVGPPPTEKEEGEEEVYASHGEVTDEAVSLPENDTKELQEQLKGRVMQKLFNKLRPEVVSHWQPRSAREITMPPVSVVHQREPLLANRHSARRETFRKQQAILETELGSILVVSPLPRRAVASQTNTQSSRFGVTLPPIDPPRGSASAIPLSVLGRQTRLVQPRNKISR